MSSIMKYCRKIKLETREQALPTSSSIISLNTFVSSSGKQNWKMKAKESRGKKKMPCNGRAISTCMIRSRSSYSVSPTDKVFYL